VIFDKINAEAAFSVTVAVNVVIKAGAAAEGSATGGVSVKVGVVNAYETEALPAAWAWPSATSIVNLDSIFSSSTFFSAVWPFWSVVVVVVLIP